MPSQLLRSPPGHASIQCKEGTWAGRCTCTQGQSLHPLRADRGPSFSKFHSVRSIPEHQTLCCLSRIIDSGVSACTVGSTRLAGRSEALHGQEQLCLDWQGVGGYGGEQG